LDSWISIFFLLNPKNPKLAAPLAISKKLNVSKSKKYSILSGKIEDKKESFIS
jgi:hypothetical protein